MVSSVGRDPGAFAVEACRVDLIHPDVKDMMRSIPDIKGRARSLLQIIEGKIKGQPLLFHRLLAVLRKLPHSDMNRMASVLQTSYGECISKLHKRR